MEVLLTLARSRKFWAAVVGLVASVVVALGGHDLPQEALITAITTIVSVFIGSVAVEDAAKKRSPQ